MTEPVGLQAGFFVVEHVDLAEHGLASDSIGVLIALHLSTNAPASPETGSRIDLAGFAVCAELGN